MNSIPRSAPLALALVALLLCGACQSKIDKTEALQQMWGTRHDGELLVRDHGEPRSVMHLQGQSYAGDARSLTWDEIDYSRLGQAPVLRFVGDDLLVMTCSVWKGGTKIEPVAVTTSQLWRVRDDESDELLFETDEFVLGKFVPRGEFHALAIRYDAEAAVGMKYGTALLRYSDGALGSMPLSGFEKATYVDVDPLDDSYVVLGQRPQGFGQEWGLFRLEGVDRRAVMWRAKIVAPAFSADTASFAYAWRPDVSAAASGESLDDGVFGRITWIDRATDAGRHLDTGLNVVAIAFEPRDRDQMYALGRVVGETGRWELLTIQRGRNGLSIEGRLELPLR